MSALLLDTHVLIWWLAAPAKLSRRVHALLERRPACVSVLSVWEARLKQQKRGLTLPGGDLAALIVAQRFALLPLKIEHVQAAADLAPTHPDPYDRLLVGTAQAERMIFVTRDAALLEYAAPLLGDLLVEA